ncbi:MAG: DUF3575 domain-containing protein [Bacteroidales bacterium]|nr:DUF3575 domain-containing protein [Bacteroidales bacterium]
MKNYIISLALLLLAFSPAYAQEGSHPADAVKRGGFGVSIRTNLAWDAAAEPNLGLEFAVGNHWSIGANAGFKSWPRWLFWDNDNGTDSRHWRNFAVVPELRFYSDEVFKGFFAGADLIYTHFNVGNVTFPFNLYPVTQNYRVQGDFWGGGLFAGYAWWPWQHWRLEVEAGIVAGLAAYDRYECEHCGSQLASERKPALVPKIGVNVAYNPVARDKRKPRNKVEEPVLEMAAPEVFAVQLKEAPDSAAGILGSQVLNLIKAQRYHDALRAIRADETVLERIRTDAEALNAYGITLYFTALDNKDRSQEQDAIGLLKEAARMGSGAAAQNLKEIDVYGPARKEYEAWQEIMKLRQK